MHLGFALRAFTAYKFRYELKGNLTDMIIARALRRLMKEHQLTVPKLAKISGLSGFTLRNVLSSRTENKEILEKLAEVFNIDVKYFYSSTEMDVNLIEPISSIVARALKSKEVKQIPENTLLEILDEAYKRNRDFSPNETDEVKYTVLLSYIEGVITSLIKSGVLINKRTKELHAILPNEDMKEEV